MSGVPGPRSRHSPLSMTRDKALVAAVQVGAAIRASMVPSDWKAGAARVAMDLVVLAASLPEEAIPHDVASAAIALVAWKFDGVAPKPEWVP